MFTKLEMVNILQDKIFGYMNLMGVNLDKGNFEAAGTNQAVIYELIGVHDLMAKKPFKKVYPPKMEQYNRMCEELFNH